MGIVASSRWAQLYVNHQLSSLLLGQGGHQQYLSRESEVKHALGLSLLVNALLKIYLSLLALAAW